MMPRLEACSFALPTSDGRWDRLARVLENSAHAQLPTWLVNVERIAPVPIPNGIGIRPYEANTQKLDHWANVVDEAPDGTPMLLIDADTLIVQPLDDIWDTPFDFAYTTKRAKFTINAGVVFLRVSERVRAFVRAWATENRRLLETSPRVAPWMFSHGGVNQASLASMLDAAVDFGVSLLALPCSTWNCEDSTWKYFTPDVTKIVHVKGDLRRACLSQFVMHPELDSLRQLWLAQERAAKGAMVGAR